MDWRHRAACRDEDPELFFPIGNTGPALLQIEEARAVCRRCEVVETVPALGPRVRPGRRRLGRPERGRASRAQASHRPGPGPHRLVHPRTTPDGARPEHRWGPVRLSGRERRRSPAGQSPGGRGQVHRQVQLHHGPTGRLRTASSVPPSSPSTRVRTICSPSPDPVAGSKPVGQAGPVVGHPDDQPPPAVTLARVADLPRTSTSTSPPRAPSPCSTAFCTSSTSTSASGVAVSGASSRRCPSAPDPDRRPPRSPHVDRSAPSTRSATSSKSTRSVRALATASRARPRSSRPGAPPPRAPPGPRLAGRQPAGLQPQQRRDRLQVVLHPVVDLPDGRVLADQLTLPAAQLGDVPAEHQRGRPLAVGR